MRSTELDLTKYNSDKIANQYLQFYDPLFTPLANSNIALLELGIFNGGSLHLWKDYFPNGKISGIDLNIPEGFENDDRMNAYKGSQVDFDFLKNIAEKEAPSGFDIIIDDASHIGELSRQSFWYLFDNHLKPGGIYVIEDWGTGYWEDWPDGKAVSAPDGEKPSGTGFWAKLFSRAKNTNLTSSKVPMHNHSYGMVGFIKQLVDEQGANDMTRKTLAGTPERGSKFESVTILPSVVFVKKR
ncbi:MAG: class I SAM-dependent methyltransferase [Planctomycetes bacterium]|nr:class I SAM-dependent methyltransferase [Planctomycetota bacterium]MCH9778510.1 class I SAM-dependent methyltransferase [Planctomycetota bacterium]